MIAMPSSFFIPRALKEADVVVLLGARLNWILHFGLAPRFHPQVKIIQVCLSMVCAFCIVCSGADLGSVEREGCDSHVKSMCRICSVDAHSKHFL